jgi:hypothetical protein
MLTLSACALQCMPYDIHVNCIDYHEPEPETVGPLDAAMRNGMPIHKLILMGTAVDIAHARPLLAAVVGGEATLVQAM